MEQLTIPPSSSLNPIQLESLPIGTEVWVKAFEDAPAWTVYRGFVRSNTDGVTVINLALFDRPAQVNTLQALGEVFSELFSLDSIRVVHDAVIFTSTMGYVYRGLKDRLFSVGVINGPLEPFNVDRILDGSPMSVLRFKAGEFPAISDVAVTAYGDSQVKLVLNPQETYLVDLEQAEDGALVTGGYDSSGYPIRLCLIEYAPSSIGAPVNLHQPVPETVYWNQWQESGSSSPAYRQLKFLSVTNDVYTYAEAGKIVEPLSPIRYSSAYIDENGCTLTDRGGSWRLYECSEATGSIEFGTL